MLQQLFLSSKIISIQTNLFSFQNFSLINRDGQTTNIGTGQTIMLTNSPNSIVRTGQQQTQPVCRNLIKQEPILYTTTSSNMGRNDLYYESNIKQTRLWQ
jgi:hypothetical protein